eukprot:TRINITY_DN9688_c0_g1_i1.p1 TRINITY_DN9688_c0_g1~~TRINITY_DN9688_c0_g1_i1.p1  ORF type:complete len:159 (+),score=17.19 TRINITY_DN9688_c0_g1_i1:55-531(+)
MKFEVIASILLIFCTCTDIHFAGHPRFSLKKSKTVEALKSRLVHEAYKHRRFKESHIYAKPHRIEGFLDQVANWSSLTPHERVIYLRQGRIQRLARKFAYNQGLNNVILSLVGKVRQIFQKINTKTGLDDKIDSILEHKDEDYQDYDEDAEIDMISNL